jgi:hypothetical protein
VLFSSSFVPIRLTRACIIHFAKLTAEKMAFIYITWAFLPFPCHICAFFQFVCPAKTRWRCRQQFVGDDEDDDEDDDGNDDNNDADTTTAVGGDDNGGNSDGRGHRQQSTKIGSEDTVAVATAIR